MVSYERKDVIQLFRLARGGSPDECNKYTKQVLRQMPQLRRDLDEALKYGLPGWFEIDRHTLRCLASCMFDLLSRNASLIP